MTRRRGVDGSRVGELYDTSTGLLDRLLLAFVAAHEVATREMTAVSRTPADPPAADGAARVAHPAPGS